LAERQYNCEWLTPGHSEVDRGGEFATNFRRRMASLLRQRDYADNGKTDQSGLRTSHGWRIEMTKPTTEPLRRILVPLDGSSLAEEAIPYALAIGGPAAALTLFHVAPRPEAIYGLFGKRLLSVDQVDQASTTGAKAALAEVRAKRIPLDRDVSLEVSAGDYAHEILQAAVRLSVDLIVMASHGRGGLDRWIIGSVADRVARTTTVPLMIVHPAGDDDTGARYSGIERLVVPLDGSDLAAQALPFAARVASTLKIPIRLINVSDYPHDLSMALAYGSAFSEQVYAELLEEGRAQAESILVEASAQLQGLGVGVDYQIVDGPIAKGIIASTESTDLLVMTSHGRGGLRRLLLGSVANQVINEGNVPVVLVPATTPASHVENQTGELINSQIPERPRP
jgi:nucleotide-binding universal stress UspA family protein